jgi:hypothetical protein
MDWVILIQNPVHGVFCGHHDKLSVSIQFLKKPNNRRLKYFQDYPIPKLLI